MNRTIEVLISKNYKTPNFSVFEWHNVWSGKLRGQVVVEILPLAKVNKSWFQQL